MSVYIEYPQVEERRTFSIVNYLNQCYQRKKACLCSQQMSASSFLFTNELHLCVTFFSLTVTLVEFGMKFSVWKLCVCSVTKFGVDLTERFRLLLRTEAIGNFLPIIALT